MSSRKWTNRYYTRKQRKQTNKQTKKFAISVADEMEGRQETPERKCVPAGSHLQSPLFQIFIFCTADTSLTGTIPRRGKKKRDDAM